MEGKQPEKVEQKESTMKRTALYLKQKQSLPLEQKIILTSIRLKQWYDTYNGQVYISFSGGKDSTVLLHIARKLYPKIEAVFIDTGLEYPEIKEFVRKQENVTWLKPKLTFKEVLDKYGYPLISKEVAQNVEEARRGYEKKIQQLLGIHRLPNGKLSTYNTKKWGFLLNAPFKISHQCCNVMKKNPAKSYEKKTQKKAIIATLATESRLRKSAWIKDGCNAFHKTRPTSTPLSFWTENDILQYIHDNNLEIASIYGDIVKVGEYENILGQKIPKYKTTKADRTGCIFCTLGVHLEKAPNRFQKLKQTHPKIYEYCFKPKEQGGLNLGEILDFIQVQY